ncbi:MAG: alpha/beta hydrolase [Anaerolineae bacterium]|nr:alpha/beta hydrolase [Anaerolineae bacterium]
MPLQREIQVGDVRIAAYEWGQPRADQPSILFAHATGFHGRIWDQVIAHLPGWHCITFDFRGHGRSTTPAPPYEWRFFADDVLGVAQAFGLRGAVGVGHSLGGHAITAAAARQPGLFAALLLIDPVILPRDHYVGVVELEHFTARRRSDWASPDEMYERFSERPPFDRFQPEVLHDYVDYGLKLSPGGAGCVLACAPAYEAATYNYGSAANIYPEIATIAIPVTILRAGGQVDASVSNFAGSPTAPDLAAAFPNAVDVPLPQYSHFIPMEAPEMVAEYVRKVATGR